MRHPGRGTELSKPTTTCFYNSSIFDFISEKKAREGEGVRISYSAPWGRVGEYEPCVFQVVLLIHLPMVTSRADLVISYIPCRAMSIMDYCMMFQAVAHTAVACNRLTCFAGASFHDKIWENRRGRTIVFIAMCILPLLLISLNLVIPCRYQRVGTTGLGRACICSKLVPNGLTFSCAVYIRRL